MSCNEENFIMETNKEVPMKAIKFALTAVAVMTFEYAVAADYAVSDTPKLVLMSSDPTLRNRPCVDFGEIASQKSLLFDPVGGVNGLSGIGTVFLVFNSENGGGALRRVFRE